MKKNTLVFGIIGIAFTAVGVFAGIKNIKPETPRTPAVDNFFAQTMPDDKGKAQNLSQWKGKTLLVNFWATWCGPCVQEMPELSGLQTSLTQKNTQIIGIGIDSPSNIAEFSLKHKIAYPLYVAGMSGTDLSRAFGNQGGALPFTVLIGPDGQIKKTWLGRLKMEELRKDISSL